jgi:5-formyltetrahydrofolate cyclo-ligase
MGDRHQTSRGKALLRQEVRAARAAGLSPEERREASDRICTTLAVLPELAAARVVAAFAPTPEECDIDAFLRGLLERGVGLLLPWVDGDDLRLARVRDLARDLVPGWRDLREPDPHQRRPARPDRVEGAVVPGLAFDAAGHRLGRGGGHYDRLLARLAPGTPVVGVAFDLQVVPRVPTEPHDRPVSVIVTERRVIRPA